MAEAIAVNPWIWQDQLGFSQAIQVQGGQQVVYCAGQTSVDGSGNPIYASDIAKQINQALDNLEIVLRDAGLTLADVVRLNYYTTDMTALSKAAPAYGPRLAAAGCKPVATALGVTSLFHPSLMIEIEATAVGSSRMLPPRRNAMNEQDTVHIVRRIADALGRGDLSTVLNTLAHGFARNRVNGMSCGEACEDIERFLREEFDLISKIIKPLVPSPLTNTTSRREARATSAELGPNWAHRRAPQMDVAVGEMTKMTVRAARQVFRVMALPLVLLKSSEQRRIYRGCDSYYACGK